ncbi:MAG TPA: 30S ribosomal protein S6 [Candidatus Moranbacteria bacterium]|nr:30S ribosomal protein S6 [Candidatus Moranbacteria bacterium]
MEYEICYLIGESKESNLDKIREAVEAIIKKHQGKIGKEEFVKKRRLSYEIKKEARGTYVAKRFSLPNKDEREEKFSGIDFIGEITKELNFDENVLRFVIVKADDVPALSEIIKKEEASRNKVEARGENEFTKKMPAKKTFVKKDVPKEKETEKKTVIKKAEKKDVEKKEDRSVIKKEVKKSKKEEPKKEKKVESKKIVKSKKETDKDTDKISEKNIDDKLDEILNI